MTCSIQDLIGHGERIWPNAPWQIYFVPHSLSLSSYLTLGPIGVFHSCHIDGGENGSHNDADPFIVAEPFHSAGRRKSGI